MHLNCGSESFRIHDNFRKLTFFFSVEIFNRNHINGCAKKLTRSNNCNTSQFSLVEEFHLIKASFKIFLIFFVFWTPGMVSVLILRNESWVPDWLFLYAALLAHSNSTFNYFVYYTHNRAFRKSLGNLLRRFLTKQSCST